MKLHVDKIFYGAVAAVLLSSCSVGEKYRKPDLHEPSVFRISTAVTGDTVSLPWKTFFKDSQLRILIEKALEKNKEVSVAMLSIKQLELSYKQAKLGLLPEADFKVAASRSYLSKKSLNGSLSEQFTGKSYLDDYAANLSISWEADFWGKAAMQKESAKAGFLMQRENAAAVKTRIIAQVAQAYYNLLALDKQVKVAEVNIELSSRTLEIASLQFQSGQVNSLAVAQAEAQKKTAELLVPQAKQNIALQENALSILCGSFPDSVHRAESLDDIPFDESFPVGVPAELLSRRPDLKAAEYDLMQANADTGLAKAQMYPSLNLTPSLGPNSFEFSSWFNLPGSLAKTISASITQPLFQRRKLRTNYEIAEIEKQKSAENFRLAFLTAVGEVTDALAKKQYADEKILLIDQKKTSLEKASKDALMLYKSGMATYLEVIAAQNSSLQNDLEEITVKKERLDASIELYRTLGGGTE